MYRQFPLWAGNTLGLVGTVLGVAVLLLPTPNLPGLLVLFQLFLAWALLIIAPHCLAHFVVGSIFGIKFEHYFLGRSAVSRLNLPLAKVASRIPIPVIRIRAGSLVNASKFGRAAMFASGAVVSMVLPFLAVSVAIQKAPTWVAVLLLLATLGNLAFDLYFSPRVGDISRSLRELRK